MEQKSNMFNEEYRKNWVTQSAQTINSPEYKELKPFIHMPYRKIDQQNTKCYYFPTYVIFKVKNITSFDFESLSAKINGTLVIDILVDYKDLFSAQQSRDDVPVRKAIEKLFNAQLDKIKEKDPQNIGQTVKQKTSLFIQFNRDNPLRLPSKRVSGGQIEQKQQQKEGGIHIIWTIRKQFTISLVAGTIFDDLIAPFNLLNFNLTMTFEEIDVELDGNEMVKFKFNCMRRVGNDQEKGRIFEQLNFTDDGSLGEYDLAETSFSVKCQKFKTQQNQKDTSSFYESYKVITFNIAFYKYPIMDSLTIFIPLGLITILTLFTFVQGPDFNDKIGNIATLMIVYVGLMPVISDSLPPTTSITLIDIVVYFQLSINILCLIRGYIIKDYDTDAFNNYFIWQDPLFIVSFSIACFSGAILISLLVYYCVMKSWFYNLEESQIEESERKTKHWVSTHMYNEARNIKTSIRNQESGIRNQKSNES